jgi:hypothetical protein
MSASNKSSSGHLDGIADGEKDAASVARAGDGDAASLVAKEERNKVLIMEWTRLRCRRSAAIG